MRLNCDLGESYGSWRMGMDDQVMPHIDQANIACGFHAGDPVTKIRTIQLATSHGVEIGAHPSYPDLVGFGRRSMHCSKEEIIALIQYQVAALDGLCRTYGAELSYVKPHGALYNDMMRDVSVRRAIMQAIGHYAAPLKLMLLATQESDKHAEEAAEFGLELLYEGFADRLYTDAGALQARSEPNAVHDEHKTIEQAVQIASSGKVTTASGNTLALRIDSLCVHGDNPHAVEVVQKIRQKLQ